VIDPLREQLGYDPLTPAGLVPTREEQKGEDGGYVMATPDGSSRLRVLTTDFEVDLEAPARRGLAYRYSPVQVARRVLLASGERVGLITNGVELRVLISEPARTDSQIVIWLGDAGWRKSWQPPDSFRLVLALCSPAGLAYLPDLIDAARLMQAKVTKDLRVQARQAVEGFVQEVLDHTANAAALADTDRDLLARDLWHEGLILVYRLLFILKMESSDDPARVFSFASTTLWTRTFSPSLALARYARAVLHDGAETGELLEQGLRSLFRLFVDGLECTELKVKPLGGVLFGEASAPRLSGLKWGERAVAHLLVRLLWTPPKRGSDTPMRVHYGSLDVEDLGRVYEALLELEPGIASEPMCRLRRQKLEVVVPVAQGERYRTAAQAPPQAEDPEADEEPEEVEDDAPTRGKNTKVEWVEEIRPGRFYLRVGLGREASGSFYTPHAFVRFLVQETLGPQVTERSPAERPQPAEILRLKVLDPAMGSGHFLVEACRFLGDKLYEAARFCDEWAIEAQRTAEQAETASARRDAEDRAWAWREALRALPDPEGSLLAYLPSRVTEGSATGFSEARARAICRRLVAVHCLYGVDKNPLAVELAKLALWLESGAEGLPLTFLDHRLVIGDSLTGPSWTDLLEYPSKRQPVEGLIERETGIRLQNALAGAMRNVDKLESTIGTSLAEVANKHVLKCQMDRDLAPFRVLTAAWAGGVMLGPDCDDLAYASILGALMLTGDIPEQLPDNCRIREMIALGLGVDVAYVPTNRDEVYGLLASKQTTPALPFDLTFPDVFYPTGAPWDKRGFDAVLGNPPWEKLRVERRDIMAALDPEFLEGREAAGVEDEHERLLAAFKANNVAQRYESELAASRSAIDRTVSACRPDAANRAVPVGRDAYHFFLLKSLNLVNSRGGLGMVLGGGFVKAPTEAGIRNVVFHRLYPRVLAHFFNLRQLFGEASSRISFVLLVGDVTRRADAMRYGFDLSAFEDVSADESRSGLQTVRTPEPLDEEVLNVLSRKNSNPTSGASGERLTSDVALDSAGIVMSEGINRTLNKRSMHPLSSVLPWGTDARLPDAILALIRRGALCLYGGKSIDAYNCLPTAKSGKWIPQVDIVLDVSCDRVSANFRAYEYYRMAWRNTCGHIATNERSARACVLPYGVAAAGSLYVETAPWCRPTSSALVAAAIINSFTFDEQLRSHVQTNFNRAMLRKTDWPDSTQVGTFLAHCCLRLTCVHSLYEAMWSEQVGDEWREAIPPLTWPVGPRSHGGISAVPQTLPLPLHTDCNADSTSKSCRLSDTRACPRRPGYVCTNLMRSKRSDWTTSCANTIRITTSRLTRTRRSR